MRFIAKRKDEIAKVIDAASDYVVGMAELEKAIKYHEEMAKERYLNDGSHKQYAEWLKELKGLRLLLDWAIECHFGYDNIPEEYEKYKHKIEDMDYTRGVKMSEIPTGSESEENDDVDTMLEHLWNDVADEESEVEVRSRNFIQLKRDVLNNKQLWRKLREIEDEDSD